MTGKKYNGQKSTSTSTTQKEHETITEVVKSILTETNILQETVKTKCQQEKCLQESETLLQNFKTDADLLDFLAFKVSEHILNNENFKQIVCNSLSLEVHDELDKMKRKIETINKKNENLENLLEAQEQYSRRNCLLIHGLPAEINENTDNTVIKFLEINLGINVTEKDLDRSHRLSRPNSPIIVKLISHNLKTLIFSCKKKLKGKNFFLTESLTPKRMSCIKKLNTLREAGKIKSFWSNDGKIFYTLPNKQDKRLELNIDYPDKILSCIDDKSS